MSQVLLYLPFRNPEHASQLIGGHSSIRQEINEALTQGPFERYHALWYGLGHGKSRWS